MGGSVVGYEVHGSDFDDAVFLGREEDAWLVQQLVDIDIMDYLPPSR